MAHSLLPSSQWVLPFVGSGAILYVMSVVAAGRSHGILAFIAFATLGTAVLRGDFQLTGFVDELPTYLSLVAVLLVLSVAGYPLRASHYEQQIRSLFAALQRRRVAVRSIAAGLGHVLGVVLDIGSLVLVDTATRQAAPEQRTQTLLWAARAFTLAPLWSNLNMLTVTTIALAGISYPHLLAASGPFVVCGLILIILLGQRHLQLDLLPAASRVDRRAIAVLAYPLTLVVLVASGAYLRPDLPLTFIVAVTVTVTVATVAFAASVITGQASAIRRLGHEARGALTRPAPEFALFGSAGIFVISMSQLGALDLLGDLFTTIGAPEAIVVVIFFALAVGFMLGIHSIPMVLLIDAAFPLQQTDNPVLFTLAVLLGNSAGMLMTPFSTTTAMLGRLTGYSPFKIGPASNWRFGLLFAPLALAYLFLLQLVGL